MKSRLYLGTGICLAMLSANCAFAQEAAEDAGGFGEIVVTAQKRSESLQKVPIAVSAFAGDALAERAITDVTGLTGTVPNFTIGTYNGQGQISIRGLSFDSINPGSESRVAAHLDGVYLSRPATTTAGFYDIERVEVLRGPQGTLYGRNATAGSVNFITRDPSQEFGGYLKQTIGNYSHFLTEGALTGGLTESISARIAGRFERRGGYGENILTGNDIDNVKSESVRGKILFDGNKGFSLLLSADYHHEDDNNYVIKYQQNARPDLGVIGAFALGETVAPKRRDVAYDVDPTNRRTFWGTSATATLELGSVTLKSITAYRYSKYRLTGSFDGMSGATVPYTSREKSRQFSEELQLSQDSDAFSWIAGGYYFHEKGDNSTGFPLRSDLAGYPGPVFYLNAYYSAGSFRTKAAAIFGQLTWKVTPELSITVGERVGYDEKRKLDISHFDFVGAYQDDPTKPYTIANIQLPAFNPGKTSGWYHTPKINVSYQINPRVMVYATYARGFKSGGFDIGGAAAAYKPEKLDNFEVGLKGQFLDNRLRTNLSAFYYDYKNIQASVTKALIIAVENAASGKLYGLEAEITVIPFDGFELGFNGGYLHSEYKGYTSIDQVRPELGPIDLTGNQLSQAPKYNTDVSAQYSFGLTKGWEASLRGNWRYRSRVYFSPFNVPWESAEPHHIFDASLNLKDDSGRWTASIYGRNLTNERVRVYNFTSIRLMGHTVTGVYNPPRTFGASVGYHF